MLSLLAALVLPLAAQQAPQPVKNPGIFTYAIQGDVDSLDPDWAFDSISQEIQFQVYETLIFFRGSAIDEFDPLLATSVPTQDNGFLSDDGLTYAFPLRKGVRFHDGTPMTPEDVKYSLLRFMLLDRAGGPSHLLLNAILGVQTAAGEDGKPDPDVYRAAADAVDIEAGALVIRLKRPYPALLSILAQYAPVVSKKWIVARGGWDGRLETWAAHFNPAKDATPLYDQENGTGPFKLARWDKPGRELVLERNEGYWRQPAPLDYVVFQSVDDPGTRELMLQTGDADSIMLERQFLAQVASMPGTTIIDDLPLLEVHDFFAMTFHINATANPYVGSGQLDGNGIPPDFFSDIDVRRAFAYSFDNDAYLRDGYRSKGQPARGPIPAGVFGYNQLQPVYSRDPQRAENYFRKAFGGRLWDTGFRFTLAYMEGAADRELACQIMKADVESLNPRFHVDVRGLDWPAWLADFTAGRLPMVNARWQLDYPDPAASVFPMLDGEGFFAKAQGYDNPRVDRLIAQAVVEPVQRSRRLMYYDLQQIAYSDIPQIYTVDTFFFQVNRSWVRGWYYNPFLQYGYFYPVYKEES